MFFSMVLMLRRLSSMNFVGSSVSICGVCGKLYLVVVAVYCGC